MFKRMLIIMNLIHSQNALAAMAMPTNTILIQAPGTNSQDFNEMSLNRKNTVTYIDLQIQRLQSNPKQEEKIFSLGEHIEKTPSEISKLIDLQSSESPLTTSSLSFLKDLSEKILARSGNIQGAAYFKNLFCKSAGLADEITPDSCLMVKVDLSLIHRQWPQVEALAIESKRFYLNESAPSVNPQSFYHWTLLSNTQKAVSFYGTYSQLMQQSFATENLVEGSCQGFSSNIDDFEVSSKALIFFSKDCVQQVSRPQQPTSFRVWLENNKNWIYPVGALIIGGAIMATQGQTLIIDKP